MTFFIRQRSSEDLLVVRQQILKEETYINKSFKDWCRRSFAKTFISLSSTSFLYTLEKLEKALKTTWRLREKKD